MAQAVLDVTPSPFSEESQKALKRAKLLISVARAAGLDRTDTAVIVDEAAEVLFRLGQSKNLIGRSPEHHCLNRVARLVQRVSRQIVEAASWEGPFPLDQVLALHGGLGAITDGR